MPAPLDSSRTPRGAVPCPGCQYDLSATFGPQGAHCPECGRTFTDAELKRELERSRRWSDVRHLWIFAIPTIAFLLGIACEVGLRAAVGWGAMGALATVVGLASAYIVSFMSLIKADDAPWPILTAIPLTMLVVVVNVVIMFILGFALMIVLALLFEH
jgi:hypothetical protein